jgi:hypothetical protein
MKRSANAILLKEIKLSITEINWAYIITNSSTGVAIADFVQKDLATLHLRHSGTDY